MALVYPPYVEGKIRSQVENIIEVPFQLNRAVGYSDVSGSSIYARIKNPSTNAVMGDLLVGDFKPTKKTDIYLATFKADVTENTDTFKFLSVGQYYKLQLSFDKENYSTVAIFKCTATPTVLISELEEENINNNLYTYTGKYLSEKDTSEKVYNYWFELYKDGVLIETSGELLHNSTQDTDTKSSFDKYTLKTGLTELSYYQIRYVVRTNNDLVVASPMYHIVEGAELLDDNNIRFVAEAAPESGSIDLFIEVNDNDVFVMGEYAFYRSEGDGLWTKIGTVTFDKRLKKGRLKFYSDYTVEQGMSYQYALQRYHEHLRCKRLESEKVMCDFEDLFLSDDERQLKIRFNPKVANFKNTLLESKMDTIGGKYPFVFRNGRTKYKELSISGLISMLMDDTGDFVSVRDATPGEDKTLSNLATNLSGENFANERDFKLQVLEWLNNGKVKLFRSAAEGNYLVRLLNVSLSPNDTLGRMLHTFQATAYEIEELSAENLVKLGFLGKPIDYKHEIHFTRYDLVEYLQRTILDTGSAVVLTIENAYPNKEAIKIFFKDGTEFSPIVGRGGEYELFISPKNPVVSIQTIPGSIGTVVVGSQGQSSYPIVYEGKEVIDCNFIEVATQYTSSDSPIELKDYTRITYIDIENIDGNSADGSCTIKWNNSKTEIEKQLNTKETGTHIELAPYLWDEMPESITLTGNVIMNMYGQKLEINTAEEAS